MAARYDSRLKTMDRSRMLLLAVGAALLAAAVVYRFYPVIRGLEPSQETLFLKEREVAKFKEIIRERSDLEARSISLNRKLESMETGLLSGGTPVLAAVDIQNILTKIAGRIGVEVQTMRIIEAGKEKKSNYLSIPVQFRISCTIAQLKELLYKIESSQKYLKIESIRIDARGRGGKGHLFSYLTVVGFMKNRGV